jgi:hypothetical protein
MSNSGSTNQLERFSARLDGATTASCGLTEALKMTTWQKPYFTEVSMNAEIGSYQEDFGGRGNTPPIASTRAEAETHRDDEVT